MTTVTAPHDLSPSQQFFIRHIKTLFFVLFFSGEEKTRFVSSDHRTDISAAQQLLQGPRRRDPASADSGDWRPGRWGGGAWPRLHGSTFNCFSNGRRRVATTSRAPINHCTRLKPPFMTLIWVNWGENAAAPAASIRCPGN